MKLDLACGQRKQNGFKGVDIVPWPGVDFVWDLEKYPWEPFADNSIEEIYCSHYLEHTADMIKFMDEVWRICEDGAKITFTCPYYTSVRSWMDPTHKRVISESSFWHFDKEWRTANKLDHYPIRSNFKGEKAIFYFNSPWDKKSDEAKQFAQQHYWNVISDILVELKVVKF